MTPSQLAIAHLTKVLILVTLVGMVSTRRYRLCWSFLGYLIAVLTFNTLMSFWMERFWVPLFWVFQQVVCDSLKVAVAIELTIRIFRAFPQAKRTAGRVLFTLLLLTAIALIGVPAVADYRVFVLQWEPRVLTGTICLLNGLALVVAWYRLPVRAFHKAILLGFLPYLLIFTTILHITHERGWKLWPYLQTLEPCAYVVMAAFWAWAAWRPEQLADTSPAMLRLLGTSTSIRARIRTSRGADASATTGAL